MRPTFVTPLFLALVPGCCFSSVCDCEVSSFTDTRTRGVSAEDVDRHAGTEGLDAAECAALCAELFDATNVTECTVGEPGDSGDTGAPDLEISCTADYPIYCEGRPPVGFRRPRHASHGDPIGRWAATAATMEAAAIPAFRRLAGDLTRLGAPAALVAEARRAMRDEVRHTRMLTRIARARGVEPGRPQLRAVAPPTLARLARHNVAAGCIEETWSALVARHQAVHAQDATIRRTMASIAVDEARHAELAWAIHRWAGVDVAPARSRAEARLRVAARAPVDPRLAATLGLPVGGGLADRLIAALPG